MCLKTAIADFDAATRMVTQHSELASKRRAEANVVGRTDPRYPGLIYLVGVHTLQSKMWQDHANVLFLRTRAHKRVA